MRDKDKNADRPEAYPKPSKSDNQLSSQEEFIDQKPSDFEDQSVSDVPSEREDRKQGRNETDR